MNEDVFWCLGNPTVYMRELSPFIHSPHRMLILASPRKGSDLEFDRLRSSQPILFQIAVTQTLTGLNPFSTSALLVCVFIS